MHFATLTCFLLLLTTPAWAAPLDPNCAEATAQRLFDHALCVCGDYRGAATLKVSGSVGVNGSVQSNAKIQVTQTLDVLGLTQSSGDISVGALQVQGPVISNGSIQVAQDAVFGGNVSANILWVGGVTTLDYGATLHGNTVPAQVTRESVQLSPPCDCAMDGLGLDEQIAAAAGHNDNAAAQLHASALHGFSRMQELRLKTGHYYLEDISGDAPLKIEAEGRVALFIGGNVSVNQDVSITALPGASIDVYVRGGLVLAHRLVFGSDTPAAARLWVLGTLSLREGVALRGLLYAPQSQLSLANSATLHGAAIVGQLGHDHPFSLTYDPNIATLAQACNPLPPAPPPEAPPPANDPPTTEPQTCVSCGECMNGGTCWGGVCSPCGESAPCCEGLVCRLDGTCGAAHGRD